MMRAVVTTEPGRMHVEQRDRPVPGAAEALLRVEMIGLCGSDYHIFDGTHPYLQFPQVQGHEFVGVVESLPDGYAGALDPGVRVAVEPLLPCGGCFACRRGRTNCCRRLEVLGVHRPGGLSDYLAVPVSQLFGVGALAAEVAVLIEPMSIGLHAVNRAGIGRGDRIAVIGAGPVGLAAAVAARDRGVEVLVVDRVASRLRAAERLGATRTFDTTNGSIDAAVADFTDGEGVAAVIEATGVASLVRTAIDLVAPSGTIVVVGISTSEVAIPVSEFSRKELNVLGARNSAGEFADAADLVSRYAAELAPLVTHMYGLDQVPDAIEFARTHPDQVEKVVISTGGGSR